MSSCARLNWPCRASAQITPRSGGAWNERHARSRLRLCFAHPTHDAIRQGVAALAEAFGGATLPADPPHAVWRAFSKLDPAHCRQLALRLIEARTAQTEPQGAAIATELVP